MIKMFLTDCDGTLTDGSMYYSAEGEALKKFNTRDAVGLRMLAEAGVITGIITGEDSLIAQRRGEKIGVDEILLGVTDKVEAVQALCDKYHILFEEIAYIGDDLNDLALLQKVGLPICPADAAESVGKVCRYVTGTKGGLGAVREAAEYVLGSLFPSK